MKYLEINNKVLIGNCLTFNYLKKGGAGSNNKKATILTNRNILEEGAYYGKIASSKLYGSSLSIDSLFTINLS